MTSTPLATPTATHLKLTSASLCICALLLTAAGGCGALILTEADDGATGETIEARSDEDRRDEPAQPEGARVAGFTRLAFQEEFDDLSGIDIGDTRAPGFSFYPQLIWGGFVLPAEHIKVSDGVLHLVNPQNHAQADLFSAVRASKPNSWNGFAVGREHGGAYFEASIAFDPNAGPKNGFPAFWTMSIEHFMCNLERPYRFLENDFMEYNQEWYKDPTSYLHACHVWTQHEGDRRESVKFPYGYHNLIITTPPETDYTQFNTFGCLWIPGEDGRIDTYFNGRLLRSVSLREYPDARVGDDHHFPIILGCGEWPMRVDWVRAWTGSETVAP